MGLSLGQALGPIHLPTFSCERAGVVAPAPRGGVLVTRPEPGATETATRLRAEGFTPIVSPMLTVRPISARFPPASRIQALLVASGNALAGIPEDYRQSMLLTVGDATASRAKRLGFVQVYSAGRDGQALAQLAAERCEPRAGPLMLASGSRQGGPIAQALRRSGFRVVRRVTYAARPVSALTQDACKALSAGTVRSALFFSAETAANFTRLVRGAALEDRICAVDAVAIGPPTGVALEVLPWRSIRIALRPTLEEMMALLP